MKSAVFQLLSNPLAWIGLGVPCIAVALFASARSEIARFAVRAAARAAPFLGGGVIVIYLVTAWAYALSPVYWDHIEANVAQVAHYLGHGRELYQRSPDGECYSMLYGPNCYLFANAMEKAFGDTLFGSKSSGAVSATLAVILGVVVLGRHGSWSSALGLGGVYAGLLLHYGVYSFWNRPDSMLAMLAILGFLVVSFGSIWGPLAFGAVAGIAFGMKAHAAIYFIPAAALARDWPPRPLHMAVAAAGFLAAAALPFLAWRNIGWANYLHLLQEAGGHGFDRRTFVEVVRWLGKLSLPVALLIVSGHGAAAGPEEDKKRNRFYIAVACAVGLAVIPATKAGAGAHHLMPLIFPLFLCAGWLLADSRRLRMAQRASANILLACLCAWSSWAVFTGLNRVRQLPVAWKRQTRETGNSVLGDLRDVVRENRTRYNVLMATGGTEEEYRLTYYRPQLVFEGMPIGIEPAALMDYRRSGMAGPSLARLEEEVGPKPILWLVPRGGEPFGIQTLYFPHVPLFSEEFRSGFAASYTRISQSKYFDIYAKANAPAMLR